MSRTGKIQYLEIGIIPQGVPAPIVRGRSVGITTIASLKNACAGYMLLSSKSFTIRSDVYDAGLKSKAKFNAKPTGEPDNLGLKSYEGNLTFTVVGADGDITIVEFLRSYCSEMATVYLIDPFTGYVRSIYDCLLSLEESVTGNDIEEFIITGVTNGDLEDITSVTKIPLV